MIAYLNRYICLFASIILFEIPSKVLAQAGQDTSATSTQKKIEALPPIDMAGSFLSMLKALAICIALLLFVVWVLKKIKSPIVTGQGRALRIIERLPVSAKSSIMLIEVNKKKILIGVGSDPVHLISDFVESESMDNISGMIVEEQGEKK